MLSGLCALWLPGWWMDYGQQPVQADMIVVLAGGVARPLEGAELYKKGYAPQVWISRPYRPQADLLAERSGAFVPKEEDVNASVLRARGVPAGAVRPYGRAVKSTLNEALAFAAEARPAGKTILLVTSRWHLRRAAWIFRSALPQTRVVAVASRFEPFTRRWWSKQFLARAAITESAKMLYYLLGGRFITPLEDTPHVS